MKADGTGQHPVFNVEGRYFNPSFSADGTRIVYTRCRPDFSGCGLFKVHLDGTDITQITALGRRGVLDFDARYSPGGGRIAFSSFKRGGIPAAIYTVHPDGTSVRRVTPARLQGFQPDWDPRGRLLVFATNCCGAGNPAIWRIRADGARLKQLSHPGARSDLKPVFSPSGVWIAFERLPQGASLDAMPSLWVMKSDGSGSHLVRRRADHVSWAPAPQN
jgi:Tol biopolymer transport system component